MQAPMRAAARIGSSLALLLAVLAAAAEAGAPASPLPGIGAHDPRVRIDPAAAPWRGVGKLQATSGNLHQSCTATLVGLRTVLTAAHCLFNPRTRRYFPPSALHFLLGYAGGDYEGEGTGTQIRVASGYDPRQPLKTLGRDWALVRVDAALGTPDRILRIRPTQPEPGARVMIGGYSQDHRQLLTADPTCRIIGAARDAAGDPVLRHDCAATRGASGAPVLVQDGAGWGIGGIDVAAEKGAAAGIVAIVVEAAPDLE